MGNSNEKHATTSLRDKEIQMLMAATRMTREEILQWHSSFLAQYQKGYINEDEFKKIFKEIYKSGNPDKFAKFAFNAFDLNHDKKLSFQEFIVSTAFYIKQDALSEERAERLNLAFDIFDINHDGKIDRKELLKLYTAVFKLKHKDGKVRDAKEHVSRVLNEYDTNGDGYLNKQEFVLALRGEDIFSFFE